MSYLAERSGSSFQSHGNQVSGSGTSQFNVQHYSEQNYNNYINVAQTGETTSSGIQNVTLQSLRASGIFENYQPSMPHQFNSMFQNRSLVQPRRASPQDEAYEHKRQQINRISSQLYHINQDYIKSHVKWLNPKNRRLWDSVRQQLSSVKTIQIFVDDLEHAEAIRNHICEDRTGCIEDAFNSVEATQLAFLSFPTTPASTENMKGPSKKMEKVVKIKCEKLKGRKKALPRMDRSTRMNRALKPQIRALYEKINIMISEYKHLQRRWNLFSNIECARKAFIMLHTILYHQCRQHEDHDIDIYLQYGAEYKSNFDLKVRITAPSSGGPLCCTFRPTETVAATSVSTKQGIECLCALLSQPIIPTLSLQYGGTLASQLPDKVIRVEMSLPVAGKYLRRRKRLLVQLAQQIATAVLNLHCTPCESMIWTCENLLLFFEKEKPSEEDVLRSLDKLHFRVHLRKSTLGASDSFESNEEGVFFSFGLVLYELWTFLRLPGPRPLPINKENMRLEHRQRLLEVIHKQVDYWVYNGAMLQEYAELIEWCLRTPIREIGNMGESKMYDRVICQLEKIGERYISAKDGALLVL